MSDQSERTRRAAVWYNLTVQERWNVPILIRLFGLLAVGGVFFSQV